MTPQESAEMARIKAAQLREEQAEEIQEARRIKRQYGNGPLSQIYITHGDQWLDEEQADWEAGT